MRRRAAKRSHGPVVDAGRNRLESNLHAIRDWFRDQRKRDRERVWIEERLQEAIEQAQGLSRRPPS